MIDLTLVENFKDDQSLKVRMKDTTFLYKAFNLYCTVKKLNIREFYFYYDGNRCSTPKENHMENGDILYLLTHQTSGKPVILMYPTEETKIESVSVSLDEKNE